MTDSTGAVISNCTFNPFGEQVGCSPDNPSNHYRFTGKERDAESDLDDFGARYFSSSMGRWMTPDWSARPTTVPYAEFGDPQSLNLYLYVRNDPVSVADVDGHFEDNADPDHPIKPPDNPTQQAQSQGWSLSWQVSASASFLGQELKGVADATITPVVSAVEHPVDTVKGLANAVAHPVQTAQNIANSGVGTVKAAASGDPRAIGQVVATVATVAYAAENVRPQLYENAGGGGVNILNTPTTGSRIGLDVHGIPEAGGAVRPHIDITIKKPGVPSGPGSNLVNIKHWPW